MPLEPEIWRGEKKKEKKSCNVDALADCTEQMESSVEARMRRKVSLERLDTKAILAVCQLPR